MRIALARKADAVWVKKLLKWIESCQLHDEVAIKKELALWVDEYVQVTHEQPAKKLIVMPDTIINTIH